MHEKFTHSHLNEDLWNLRSTGQCDVCFQRFHWNERNQELDIRFFILWHASHSNDCWNQWPASFKLSLPWSSISFLEFIFMQMFTSPQPEISNIHYFSNKSNSFLWVSYLAGIKEMLRQEIWSPTKEKISWRTRSASRLFTLSLTISFHNLHSPVANCISLHWH